MQSNALDTSFYFPHWLVELLADSFLLQRGQYTAKAKFLPHLKPAQSRLLLPILSKMQQQLLALEEISIPFTEISNDHLSPANLRQAKHFLQELFSFRLLYAEADNYEARKAYPLFAKETWHEDKLTLQPAQWGSELLLGYCEPYRDWLRQKRGEVQLSQIFQDAPLRLWKSLWFDTKGEEQIIYLRLEESAQQDKQLLTTPCQNINTLAKNLHSELFMRNLSSLGKKLVEHGYLASCPPTEIISAEVGTDFLVNWSSHRLDEGRQLLKSYEKAVVRYFGQRLLPDTSRALTTTLTPKSASADTLQKQYADILKNKNLQAQIETAVMLAPNRPLLNVSLFFDWLLRKASLHDLPLPAELANSDVSAFINPTSSVSLLQRCISFCKYLRDKPQFVQAISASPTACLVNLTEEERGATVALQTQTVAVLPSKSQFELQREKTASRELEKIKSQSREDYLQLERKYLASLDNDVKESILELKKCMQASVFEKQLRPRIISFMLSNPSVWKKPESFHGLRVFDS